MKTTLLAAFLLMVATTAHAQPGRVVIECATPLTVTQSTAPPVVVVPPPPVPPVVVPPAPPVDNSPFPFPPNCPGENNDPAARYFSLTVAPSGPVYAAQREFGNPAIGSYVCVGLTALGARATYGSLVENMILWAPRGTPPSLLRCLLATGRPCP